MSLTIRNDDVDRLAETLATRQKISKTAAVKLALENELRRLDRVVPLKERLRAVQDRVLSHPTTGQAADKDFYDDLSGGL